MPDYISLEEVCRIFSISAATGRNWIRLGRLTPAKTVGKTPYFSTEYIDAFEKSLKTDKNSLLKSRRNKKYISGNNIYNSYVSKDCKAAESVQELLEIIHEKDIEVTDALITALVAECALRLLWHDTVSGFAGNCLEAFLEGKLPLGGQAFLINDMLTDKESAPGLIRKYPELFHVAYRYEPSEDILGLLYISLKNCGSRKAAGSYYTPTDVVKKMCGRLFTGSRAEEKLVLDPCCGTGNFLLQLPEGIPFENIYANDIDPVSVGVARINMVLKYGIKEKQILYEHITAEDYLSRGAAHEFDCILGNPPWGYDFTEEQKKYLRDKYHSAAGTNIESYDVFIEQALNDLRTGGVLSFVLPEALLNVKAHFPVREILVRKCSFQHVSFLGNVFDKVQCPCIILQVSRSDMPAGFAGMSVSDGRRDFIINTERKTEAVCFSFTTTDEEYAVLDKIEHLPGQRRLAGNADFALGIVTGNNQKYISGKKDTGNERILKGSDLYKFRFRPSSNYIAFHSESFQQCAPEKYYRAKEKLLYRFICSQLVFAYDDAQMLSLNSCNLLIPHMEGLDIKYILAVLNSRIAQFYFKKRFNSVKVLRSHIEQIPVPWAEKEQQKTILQSVEHILAAESRADIKKLYDGMDAELARLYGLDNSEYALIRGSMEGENLFLY